MRERLQQTIPKQQSGAEAPSGGAELSFFLASLNWTGRLGGAGNVTPWTLPVSGAYCIVWVAETLVVERITSCGGGWRGRQDRDAFSTSSSASRLRFHG